MAVYGNMLAAFPELMKTYEVFKMKPYVVGGYGERYDRRNVKGYWSWRKQSKMDIEGDLQMPNHQATFWVQDDSLKKKCLMEQGDFVEVNEEVFRVIDDFNFSHEGGFARCLMQKVAGPVDMQYSNMNVDRAIEDDY